MHLGGDALHAEQQLFNGREDLMSAELVNISGVQ